MNDFLLGLIYGGLAVSGIFFFRDIIGDTLFDIKLWFEYDFIEYYKSKKTTHFIFANFILAIIIIPIFASIMLGLINLMFILFGTPPYYPTLTEFLWILGQNIALWTIVASSLAVVKLRFFKVKT